MAETFPIIQTKLFRPPLQADFIPRPQLLVQFEGWQQRPLILVSASAGYGKSTLASAWLKALDCPSAWLSLDQYDNDLGLFLGYFIGAIQTIFPQNLVETQALLHAAELPPMRYLVGSLINELNAIEGEYVLVLDDYHLIELQEIHDLLNDLIQYAPQSMHLVLCTRLDPPLPLVRYRATSHIAEIRSQDLCFTDDEGYLLVQSILNIRVDQDETDALVEQSEGWVTGIRLAALSLRHRQGKARIKDPLTASNRYVIDYLVSEILENQVAIFSEGLLKTSILDRLCPGLCEVVCSSGEDAGTSPIQGQLFFDWLKTSNLFVLELDDRGEWVRYHHLFQDFLQNELARRYSMAEIKTMHLRASAWYAREGLIDEALRHALAADDIKTAVDLVVKHRHAVMNQEQWIRLQRWLNYIPEDLITEHPDLLLTQAWVFNSKFIFEEVLANLEQVQTLLDQENSDLSLEERSILAAEMAALRCIILYWVGQGQLSLDNARLVIEVTPIAHEWVRGIGLTYHAGAYQLVGQLNTAYEEMHKILADQGGTGKTYAHRAYVTYLAVELLAGKLSGADDAAIRLLELAGPRKLYDSIGWALYTRGYVAYQRNDLLEASRSFSELVEMRYRAHAVSAAHGYYGMALAHQALGNRDEAQQTIQNALTWASETGNAGMVIETNALSARLALMQGQTPDTTSWAGLINEAPGVLLLLNIPHLTLANILAVDGNPASASKARELISGLHTFAESTHTTSRLMEITAMQALLKASEGDYEEALTLLDEVVRWAESSDYIRLFADMGPKMAELLVKLNQLGDRENTSSSDFIMKLLAAFEPDGDHQGSFSGPTSSQLIEPLTNRESEILVLLGKRLTNKEISAELHITVGTVQQHLNRIYSKLDVKGRRQATAKAKELGLLPQHK